MKRHILMSAVFALTMASSCKTAASLDESDVMAGFPGGANVILDGGQRAKAYFFSLIDVRNDYAKENNLDVRFELLDSMDPRLYPPGAPIQPQIQSDKILAKIAGDGRWVALAYVFDRPGFLEFKEVPSGNHIFRIAYDADRIEYHSRFEGNVASVVRNKTLAGYHYIYYVRGFGNNITPVQFDQVAVTFMQNAALYVTPLRPSDPVLNRFAPAAIGDDK